MSESIPSQSCNGGIMTNHPKAPPFSKQSKTVVVVATKGKGRSALANKSKKNDVLAALLACLLVLAPCRPTHAPEAGTQNVWEGTREGRKEGRATLNI